MGRFTPNLYNLGVVLYAALGSIATAYALAVTGSTIGQPTFYTTMGLAFQGEPGYSRTAKLLGTMNGLSAAGSALGALFNAWSADKLSRKYSIQIGAALLIMGAALCAGSVGIAMFIVARFITGVGIGIMISVIPMYQSEVATPETRGFMVAMYGVMGATGYTLSSWIGFGCYFMSAAGSTSTFPWRFPLAFGAVPALLLLVGSPWLPFTPRWLLQQGRFQESEDTLKRLHSRKGDEHHEQAIREFTQMRRQLELDKEQNQELASHGPLSFFDIFRTPANRKRAVVTFILTVGASFTGPVTIASYAVILFIDLGLSGYTPLLLLGVWTTIAIPGNMVTALWVDRFGRKTFLLAGALSCLATLVCECALFATYVNTTNQAGQRAAVFFFFLFIWVYTAFIDATIWIYLSEIWPTHLRSRGVGFGLFNWFSSTIILLVAGPVALNNVGWKFFLVLIVPTTLFAVGIVFLFPETRQRSLEDINAAFGEKVAMRYYGATEKDESHYQHAIEIEAAVEVSEQFANMPK